MDRQLRCRYIFFMSRHSKIKPAVWWTVAATRALPHLSKIQFRFYLYFHIIHNYRTRHISGNTRDVEKGWIQTDVQIGSTRSQTRYRCWEMKCEPCTLKHSRLSHHLEIETWSELFVPVYAPAALFHSVVCIRKINHSLTPNPLTVAGLPSPHTTRSPVFLQQGRMRPVSACYQELYVYLWLQCSWQVEFLLGKEQNHPRFDVLIWSGMISVSGCGPAWPGSGNKAREWVMAKSGGHWASGTDSVRTRAVGVWSYLCGWWMDSWMHVWKAASHDFTLRGTERP